MAILRKFLRGLAFLAGAVLLDVVVALARLWKRPPDQVLDRRTGEVFDEARPLLDRVQIALVWNTFTGSQVLCRSRLFLGNLRAITERRGTSMNLPATTEDIQDFIDANGVNPSELDQPIASYSTINEFFTRSIDAERRPIAGDEATVVSPADARLRCAHLPAEQAGRVSIKGKPMSVASMFDLGGTTASGDLALSERLQQFHDSCSQDGFAVAVNRLAPGDYHRFHWPVDAHWDGTTLDLDGAYHSVAPTAVDSPVDVFGTNRRMVVLAETKKLGLVALVIVGAVKVGSITITGKPGDVHRGDELGIFAYGGSTVVTIFDARRVRFDDDLLSASQAGRETLVRMGEQIGLAGSDLVSMRLAPGH